MSSLLADKANSSCKWSKSMSWNLLLSIYRVNISFVTTQMLWVSLRCVHRARTRAVFPEPTGPPIPTVKALWKAAIYMYMHGNCRWLNSLGFTDQLTRLYIDVPNVCQSTIFQSCREAQLRAWVYVILEVNGSCSTRQLRDSGVRNQDLSIRSPSALNNNK